MITSAICLSFVSIYCLYAISDRVEIEKKGIMLFLKNRRTLARLVAGSTFFLSTLALIRQMGKHAGIYTSLSLWMLLACIMVLFLPFDRVKWPHLLIAVIVFTAIEIGFQSI